MTFVKYFPVLPLLIAFLCSSCQPEKPKPSGNLNIDPPKSLSSRSLSGSCGDNLWAEVLIDNQAAQKLQKIGDSWQGAVKVTPGTHALKIEFKCATDKFGTISLATYSKDVDLSADESLSLASENYEYPDNDHDGSSNLAEVKAGTDPGNPSNGFKWANPLPQGNNIQDIIWTGSEFLAVGTGGSILTSGDGRSWSLTHSAATNFLNSVVWSGTQYVVVGNNGTILSNSPNDSDWTPRDSGTDRHILGVTWTGSLFVAVGLGVVTTSSDGINWTPQKEVQALLTNVIWTGSKLIATGATLNDAERIEGAIFTSNDGTSWSPSLLTDIPLLWDVTWTGSQLVAVGGDKILDSEFNLGGIILTSPDGDNWVKQTSGTDVDLYAVNFDSNSGQITAAGGTSNLQTPDNPNNGVILSSADGINWTSQDSTNNQTYLSLASSGSETVVVGLAGTIKSSADLQHWSSRTSDTVNTVFDMISIGDRVIAVGENGETLTSLDGLSWASHNSGIIANLFAVTWTDSQLVAVGGELNGTKNGVIVTSTDGISWTNQTPTNSFGSIMDITWTGSQLVAVGAKGLILTSPNGVDWTSRNSATREDLWTVSSNSDLIVAAGDNGTVLTSPDSSNWTSTQELDENFDLRSITWTDSSFILVGGTFGKSGLDENSSMAFTSADGTNWSPIDPGINDVMQDVVWTGSQLLAVAFNSSLLTSTDSARWTEIPTISSNALYCVIEHQGITLIGGGNGTILYREN